MVLGCFSWYNFRNSILIDHGPYTWGHRLTSLCDIKCFEVSCHILVKGLGNTRCIIHVVICCVTSFTSFSRSKDMYHITPLHESRCLSYNHSTPPIIYFTQRMANAMSNINTMVGRPNSCMMKNIHVWKLARNKHETITCTCEQSIWTRSQASD